MPPRPLRAWLLPIALTSLMASCGRNDPVQPFSEVRIEAPDGQYLTVRPDGSGIIGSGSSVGKPFRSGTFNFPMLVTTLRKSIEGQVGASGTYAVWLRRTPG